MTLEEFFSQETLLGNEEEIEDFLLSNNVSPTLLLSAIRPMAAELMEDIRPHEITAALATMFTAGIVWKERHSEDPPL